MVLNESKTMGSNSYLGAGGNMVPSGKSSNLVPGVKSWCKFW